MVEPSICLRPCPLVRILEAVDDLRRNRLLHDRLVELGIQISSSSSSESVICVRPTGRVSYESEQHEHRGR